MLLDALIIPVFYFISTKCWYRTRVWNLMHDAHFLCYNVSLRVAQTHSCHPPHTRSPHSHSPHTRSPHSHSPHSVFPPRQRHRLHHHHHQRLLNLALVKDVALAVTVMVLNALSLVSFKWVVISRGTQRQFSENICLGDDLRPRIFGTFVVKFLACQLKTTITYCPFLTDFYP